ncbi:hypothetical protein [uncultured Croceitalea sp.]|uniref:hypothetical protein n=1 Tax=uncultured Croceitalea sp. TaxID=1798908 RepID=UPI00374EC4D0
MKSFLLKNYNWIGPSIPIISTIALTFYFSELRLNSKSKNMDLGNSILDLGFFNVVFLVGFFFLGLLIYLNFIYQSSKQSLQKTNDLRFIDEMLGIIVDVWKHNKPDIVMRALVTHYKEKEGTRVSVAGVNVRQDPESNRGVPYDYGIAGEAFVYDKVVCEDIDLSIIPTEDMRKRTWQELRCVTATPIKNLNGEKIGTLNFDSSSKLDVTKFDDRDFQDVHCRIAEIIGPIIDRHFN